MHGVHLPGAGGLLPSLYSGLQDHCCAADKLLCKDGFHWTSEAEAAFSVLQQALTSVPVLQLPAFDKEFIVECDTSSHGFGVVLHQGVGPVAFFSRLIAMRHTKLAAYERELNGLIQAIKH
jgi:hypothetical protein